MPLDNTHYISEYIEILEIYSKNSKKMFYREYNIFYIKIKI